MAKLSTQPAAISLTEAVFSEPTKIDRDASIIHGVKVLGVHSRNKGGYDYSPQALQQAATLYEGVKVNTDHPERTKPNATRSIQEGIGWLRNCKVVEGEGVYADLHVIKSHAFAPVLFEVAERNPTQLGLSHNADGRTVSRGGKRIIESVETVRSVDLVGKPATNESLFESEAPVATKKTTIKAILESVPEKTKGRKGLLALLEMDGMADMGSLPVEVPVEAESATPDDQVWSAFLAAMNDILNGDTTDVKGTMAKIEKLLAAYEENFGAGGGTGETETTEDPVTESLQEQINQLKAERDSMKADEANRSLLESKQIEVTPARLVTLKSVSDKMARAALLEDWAKVAAKPKPGVQKPARSAPLVEQDDSGYRPANSADEMLALLR